MKPPTMVCTSTFCALANSKHNLVTWCQNSVYIQTLIQHPLCETIFRLVVSMDSTEDFMRLSFDTFPRFYVVNNKSTLFNKYTLSTLRLDSEARGS